MMKTLHLLIGPKGSGKTYIGKLVERELGLPFLRVEPIWLALKPEQDVWSEVEKGIDQSFLTTDELIIESLGLGDGFTKLRQSLSRKYQLRFIKVTAKLDECLRRIQARDSVDHIAVSDAQAGVYNRLAAAVELPWSAVIDNHELAAKGQILAAFRCDRASEEPINQNRENIELSRMLKQQFGVDVPVAELASAVVLGQFQDIVVARLRKSGAPFDERALRGRVVKVVMANHKLTFRRAAYDFNCLKCHQRLGVEGVRLGNQRWKKFLANFHRQNPGRLVSFMRAVDAVCPRCGCEYTYRSEDASLQLHGEHGFTSD